MSPLPCITALAVQTPDHEYHSRSLALFNRHFDDIGQPKTAKLFDRMMARADIDNRYSVIEMAEPEQVASSGFLDADGTIAKSPEMSTGDRNALFVQHAPQLALKTLGTLDTDFDTITDLITVSCTGFAAPGLDLEIIKAMGLQANIQRTHLGFMGCFAGITALRTAKDLVQAQADRRVLIVCVELCSLHVQFNDNLENMLGQSLFADGCAAVVVEAREADEGLAALGQAKSTVVPELDGAISWHVGDRGYDLGLSLKMPNNLAAVLENYNLLPDSIAGDIGTLNWIIHPGGKAIVGAVADGLNLTTEQTAPALSVLRTNGNMSSTTVFFVLQEHLRQGRTGPGVGIAFGPGFGVEAIEITLPEGS